MTRIGPTHPSRRQAAGALMAAAVLGLAACSSDGSDGSAQATSTTAKTSTTALGSTTTVGASTTDTTAAVETTTTTIPAGTEPSALSLPEGRYQGYFKGLSDGTVEGQAVQVVAFDQVELLTGDRANEAARADGLIGDDESVPNDYYIVDDDPSTIDLPVIPDGVVTLLEPGGAIPRPGSIPEAAEDPNQLYAIEVIVVRDISLITATEAIYLP